MPTSSSRKKPGSSRLSIRVSPEWREGVLAWCDKNDVPEAELFRRATTKAFGWCPGSPVDDSRRPPRTATRRVPSVHLTWDMPEDDLARFRQHSASYGVDPGKALLIIVDDYIGRPWEILRRFDAAESAARLLGLKSLVKSLERARARIAPK